MLELLLINLIVALVFLSGWWDSMDEFIFNHFKPYHLPHIFQCGLCQVWWLSLLYVIFAGKLTLLNVMLCLVNAHLIELTIPLLSVIKEWGLKIISLIMPR